MDRQEFFAFMSEAVAAGPRDDPAGGVVPPGRAKTRVLEAHPRESSADGTKSLLAVAFGTNGLSVSHVGDELWQVHGNDLVAFVDTLDSRFWLLHTTSAAGSVARLVKHAVFEQVRLDTAWLPTWLLKTFDGRHTWMKSAFDADDLLGSTTSARRWRASFEGDAPEGLLDLLAQDPRYAPTATVTGVGSKVEAPGVGHALVRADFRGLFVTGQGNFSVAASAVWNMVRRYAAWIEQLEERNRICLVPIESGGVKVTGDVATIEFGRPVEQLARLVQGLFVAKEPFRLWAVPRRVDDDAWTADAVDLHVGQPLRLEFSPQRVRVLLEPDTCGNTVARLLTNLQQRLDARVHLLPAAA